MVDMELLEQFRKIVREEIETEAKHTHTDISLLKMEVKGAMSKLEDRVKDLEVSNGRLEKGQKLLEEGQKRLEESQKRIEEALNKEVADLADMQHEILVKLDKLESHERRITRLEEDSKFLPH